MRRPRLAGFPRWAPALALAAGLGLGLVLGCGEPPPPRVVLVTLDSVPPDGPASAALRTLAAPGARFERFYTAAPWTGPSVASMLTGRQPWEHGVLRPGDPLPRGVPTVAGALSRRTHATAAALDRGSWAARGFTRGFGRVARDVDPVGAALTLLDRLSEDGRATRGRTGQLLWVHLGEPDGGLLDELAPLLIRLESEAGRFESHLLVAACRGTDAGAAGGAADRLQAAPVRAPLLLLSPRVAGRSGDRTRRDVAGSVDVARTLLSLAGVEYPPPPWSRGRDLSAWAPNPTLEAGAGSGLRSAAFGMLPPRGGRPRFYAVDRGGGFYSGDASGLSAAPDGARRDALEELAGIFRSLDARVGRRLSPAISRSEPSAISRSEPSATSKSGSRPAPSPPAPPPPPAAGPAPP